MQKFIKIILAGFFLLGSTLDGQAQDGFWHEIGVVAGPVAFQSDYGESGDFKSTIGNVGYGVGIVHYLNFYYKSTYNYYSPENFFNDHFKVRSELSYNKTNLRHYGRWVDPSKTSLMANQLRAMRGSTAVTNLGVQLEYHPFSIRDFTATVGSFSPYIGLGGQLSFYDPESYSTLGPLNSPLTTPVKYYNATTNDGGSTWSIVSSIGTRYKFTEVSDLVIDLKFQYYFSNWVDGLNPDPKIYTENKTNDWNVWLNVGYIYYLN